MTGETGAGGRGERVEFLLTPPRTAAVTEACLERVVDGLPRDRRVLAVTTSRSGEAFVEDWVSYLDCRPRDVVAFELAESSRSTSARSGDGPDPTVGSVAVTGDLSEVARTVERLGREWETAEGRPVVYVDSASELLYGVGLPRTVEWVRGLADAVAANGWRCVLRVDRGRHDPRTVAALWSVADAVRGLTVEGDDWSWNAVDDLTEAIPAPSASDLSLDDLFDALRARRRRLVLRSLGRADRTLPVAELTDFVAARESPAGETPTRRDRERVYTGLQQIHLPKLDDLGLVRLDEATDAVERTDLARRAEPYLLLAISDDTTV